MDNYYDDDSTNDCNTIGQNENSSNYDIEHEIAKVLTDIDEVDTFLRQLNERKTKLVEKFEALKEEKFLRKSSHLAEKDWESESFPWITNINDGLRKVFKMNTFRSMQLKTINAILSKNDVLLLAPTGGGKSLCFQLPAVVNKGITIVISPLISLMEDQIWSLQKLGIKADMLSSTTDHTQVNSIFRALSDKLETSDLKLLYVTPERMAKSKRFMAALQKSYFSKKLDMIAIDEVHCCSQWGHDFRPDYKFLGSLKTMFPDVPILGVTATATTKVIVDVQKMLNIRECLILKAPFNRPNLYYHVIEKPVEKEQVLKLLATLLKKRYTGQSGIIYTFSIKDAEDLSADLIRRGLRVRPYHASLDSDRRSKIHNKWLSGEIQAVVATVAFGMGIDKPDVRFVIHHTISKSMENFYQESGRAGRDGNRSECIVLYRFGDMPKITGMMFSERTGLKNAYSMVRYCINGTSCRRDLISKHFTEVWKDSDCKKMCDRCYYKDKINPPPLNITSLCLDLYKIIEHSTQMDMKLTGCKLVDSWYQKGASNLRVAGVSPPNLDRYYAEQIVAYLIIENYLKEDFHFTAYSTISYLNYGSKKVNKNSEIIFHGARVLRLPEHCPENVEVTKKSLSESSRKRLTGKVRKSESGVETGSKDDDTPKPSKKSRKSLKEESIKRISSSVSRMVTEMIEEETKRRRLLSNHTDTDCDGDDVVVVASNEDVIVIDD